MPALDDLAEDFKDDFNSVFLYCREAHPGELFPAHETMEQKLNHARAFRERFETIRPIVVDTLDGHLHRAYGTLPNMVYVVDRRGRISYRANWTDAHSVATALRYLLHEKKARRGGVRNAPFYSELQGHRPIDRLAFMKGLVEGGGMRAAEEFIEAVRLQQDDSAAQQLQKQLEEAQSS